MGEIARIWEGLLLRVIESNRDVVGGKRLKGHLDRLAEKYPELQRVIVLEDRIELPSDFPEDDSGLMTVCTVLGALFWALDMFTGPASATERVRRPVREYISKLPEGTVLGLNRFLPKLNLEGPDTAPAVLFPGAGQAKEGGGTGGEEHAPKPAYWEGGGEEGGGVAEGVAGAELPGQEPAAQYDGSVDWAWLGEAVPRGASLLVEGEGNAKERCALRFIKEGLEAGEAALALIAYSPEEFRKRLAEEGLDTKKAEEEGRLKILDWSTFRERHIADLEDDGTVLRLPMELTSVSPGMSMAMEALPAGGSARAFVNILPQALATVAIETVFNFVQVTLLKFKKRNITGLFTMEEQKDPEKAAIRLSFPSWVEVSELPEGGGKLRLRLGGQLLSHKYKVLTPAEEGPDVESEEAIAAEEPAPELEGTLRRQMDEWRAQGYLVDQLEEALKAGPSKAKATFAVFEMAVERMRVLRNELKILDLSGMEADAQDIREMARDVGRYEQVRTSIDKLKSRIDKKRSGTALAPGKEAVFEAMLGVPEEALPARPAEPPEAATLGATPLEAAPVAEPSAASAHAEVPMTAAVLPAAAAAVPATTLAPAIAPTPAPAIVPAIAPTPAPAIAPTPVPVPDAEQEKRREFRDALAKWKEEGYEVGALEEAVSGDLEGARRAFLLFRVELQRLRELAEELSGFEAPALAERREELRRLLTDVANRPAIEKGVEELRGLLGRLQEEERARKEDERLRRAQLQEKVFMWASHGLAVERLERVLAGEQLSVVEKEIADFEPRSQRLLKLKGELAALDTAEFKEEAAELDFKLGDPERLEEAEAELAAFKEHLALHSRNAQVRRRLGDELAAWKERGLQTEHLERLMKDETEITIMEGEFERFREGVEGLASLYAKLEGMDLAGLEERAAELRQKLKDPAHLDEYRRGLVRLQEDSARLREERKERAACRSRIEEWRGAGLLTAGLEGMLDGDILSLRKAMADFAYDLQLYDELVQLLEPLLRTSHAAEAAQLQKDLRDFSRLPELEEKVLALRSKAESETMESGRELHGELERDTALIEKLNRWISMGYHVRRLEGTLKGDSATLRTEADRLESDIENLSRLASALEVLDTKGHERELEHIRSMLNDPDKLPAVRALNEVLRVDIARRKKEEERRQSLRSVVKDWEKKGYDTSALKASVEGDLEKASREFVLFHSTAAAAESLRKRLDLLELFGFEREVEALRQKLRDPRAVEEVRAQAEALWKGVDERGREKAARRKEHRSRRMALKRRMTAALENGLAVGRLERALQLPLDQAESEFARFDEDVAPLAMLEKRIASLDYPGFEAELAALRNMLNDVDRIADLEAGIADLETKVEQARLERERRKEERAARKAEEDRRASVRKHLEERLMEWEGFGLNIETLKTALESDPVIAEKKFEEFENSLYRTEELRLQLHELQAKVGGNLPGAESVERLLKDPLRLPQAERAFAELRQRAEETLRSLDTEFQSVVRRVAELKGKGEDVAELERALKRSPADAKKALAEHEKQMRNRELQDTWKGIRSRFVSAAGAQPEGTAAPAAAGGAGEGMIMKVLQTKEPVESGAQEQPGGSEGQEGPIATAPPQEAAPAQGKIVKKKRKKLTKAGE